MNCSSPGWMRNLSNTLSNTLANYSQVFAFVPWYQCSSYVATMVEKSGVALLFFGYSAKRGYQNARKPTQSVNIWSFIQKLNLQNSTVTHGRSALSYDSL